MTKSTRSMTRRSLLAAFATTTVLGALAACAAPTPPTATTTPAKPAEPAKAIQPPTVPAAAQPTVAAPAAAATKPVIAPVAPTTAPAAAAKPDAKPAGTARGGVSANAGATGTVKFLHVWGGAREPLMAQQIKDFQALWPNIKIEAELIPAQGMNEKYLTSIAGGSPPDAVMLNADQVPNFGEKNALTQLDPLLQRDGMKIADIFYDTDWKLAQFKGKTVSMPQATSGGWYMLLWNKELVQKGGLDPAKAPKTWDDLEEAAKKLTKMEGGKANPLGFDVTWHPNFPIFKQWLYNNGGQLISDDGKKITFGGEEGVQTLQWMVDFTDRVHGGFGAIQALRAELGSTRDAWYNGRSVYHVEGVWIFREAKAANPKLEIEAGMMPVNGKNPRAKSQNIADTGWGYTIPRGSKNADAAWEWVKYITAGEGNLNFFKGQLRPSPVRKFNEDPFFAQNNPHWSVVQEILKTSTQYPLTGVQAQLNKAIADMQEEALMKKKTPAQAVQDAATATQKLLDEWNARVG